MTCSVSFRFPLTWADKSEVMSLAARAPSSVGAPPAGTGSVSRKLRRGELLFSEGENSRAMYFVKAGMIRLYKKKGDSQIELDTVHTGQVVGEMAFLDGNPRSASAEALTDCDLVEVSGPTFQQVLTKMPDWLKILLKTVVGRLRTASTRIRQLETASTAFDYSEKDGKRSAHYVYLSPIDVMKIFTALLLVGSRNAQAAGGGVEIRVGLLQRYSNQIMGVPVAKITTLLDVLAECGIVSLGEEGNATQVVLRDPDFLEQLITYLNEENLMEPSKRHDLTGRGFLIMSLIAKHMVKYKKDEVTNLTTVNLAEIRSVEAALTGKEPFRMEEFQQLVKLGYCANLTIKSATETFTTVDAEKFLQAHKFQRVVLAINVVNEQKRTGAK